MKQTKQAGAARACARLMLNAMRTEVGHHMSDRRIDGFFYGLFMDGDILRDSQVAAVNPRRAYVDGYALPSVDTSNPSINRHFKTGH